MTYQLEALEQWARENIAPEILQQSESENKFKELLDFVSNEKKRICTFFREKATKEEAVSGTIKFIQAHQVGISAITDVIIGYTECKEYSLSPQLKSFYIKVCLIIEEVISFLQDYLPEYFDEELAITYMNAEISRADLVRQLGTLQPLHQDPYLDKALLNISIRPFREFVEEGKRITYQELSYLKELASGLKGLLNIKGTDLTYELHLILFGLNFNFPRYVLHYSYWLDAKISEISDRTKRLDELSRHIHAIEQIRFKPHCILIPELPSLKEQLLASIKTTYQYILTENKNNTVHHSVVEQISHNKAKHAKIRLAVSVPVLALFLKVLIRTGIIINENKADVFRGIAENFTTLKSESISFDSLRGKYNKPPMSAYIHLRSILTKILESIRHL